MSDLLKKQLETIISVITPKDLARRVERLVNSDNLAYLEAIIQICNDLDIDPEDMAKNILGPLKDKLRAEAQRNNILPRPNTLFYNEQ